MTKVLGLTGGIASGKSTISRYFQKKEIPVIDADVLAHEVMEARKPAVQAIQEIFGEEIVLENGEVDRKKLGSIVFADVEKRKQLEEIIHGEVLKEMERQKKQYTEENEPLIVLDVPLLYEVEYENQVDEVMVVYVDRETQKDRLLKRNKDLSEEEAENRINSQLSLEEKAERADVVIDNRGSRKNTRQQVDAWLDTNVPE